MSSYTQASTAHYPDPFIMQCPSLHAFHRHRLILHACFPAGWICMTGKGEGGGGRVNSHWGVGGGVFTAGYPSGLPQQLLGCQETTQSAQVPLRCGKLLKHLQSNAECAFHRAAGKSDVAAPVETSAANVDCAVYKGPSANWICFAPRMTRT